MVTPVPQSTLGKASSSIPFSRMFSMFFLTLFFIIPVIYAITISVEQHSVLPGIQYIGEKFLTPTKVIYEESRNLVETGGAYVRTGEAFKDLFNILKVYWSILQALWMTWMWIKLLMRLWGNSPASTSVQTFGNFFLAIISFLFLQTLLLSINLAIGFKSGTISNETKIGEYISMPIKSWITFIKSSPLLVKQVNAIIDPSIVNNTVNQSINLGINSSL